MWFFLVVLLVLVGYKELTTRETRVWIPLEAEYSNLASKLLLD